MQRAKFKISREITTQARSAQALPQKFSDNHAQVVDFPPIAHEKLEIGRGAELI